MVRLSAILFILSIFTIVPACGQGLLNFTVTSDADDEDSGAWDDPDTEADESADGIHRDARGRQTLRAALEEAANMEAVLQLRIHSNVKVMRQLPMAQVSILIEGTGKNGIEIDLNGVSGGFGLRDGGVIRDICIKNGSSGCSVPSNGEIANVLLINCTAGMSGGDSTHIHDVELKDCLIGVTLGGENVTLDHAVLDNASVAVLGNHHTVGPEVTVVNYSSGGGIGVIGEDNVVKGCEVGYRNGAEPNLVGVSVVGQGNIIGGTDAASRNIISGNMSAGVSVSIATGSRVNKVIGNYIGLNPAGTAAVRNGIGVQVMGAAVIGGTGSGERNVISGNGTGIVNSEPKDTMWRTEIIGNYIGTNASGTAKVPNDGAGISQSGSNDRIEYNVISGNGTVGISVLASAGTSTAKNNVIAGNIIGLNAAGTARLQNGSSGIEISGVATQNTIGSGLSESHDANTIAGNHGPGIVVAGLPSGGVPTRNTFRKNIFYDNDDLAINFTNARVQEGISAPVLDEVTSTPGNPPKLKGHGAPPGATVDIYKAAPDPSGSGEGKEWMLSVTADGDGKFEADVPDLDCGDPTATATDTRGNTSPFSNNIHRMPEAKGITASCDGPYFAGVPFTVTYTLDVDWHGLPESSRKVTFHLNGDHEKEGSISGDKATVDYDMHDAVVGSNSVTYNIEACGASVPSAAPLTFCGVFIPTWFPTPSATCGDGKVRYTRTIHLPHDALQAALSQLPDVPFVSGLIGFPGMPDVPIDLQLPYENNTILNYGADFTLAGFNFAFASDGNVETHLECDGPHASGHLHLHAHVEREFSYGLSFGNRLPSCTGLLGLPGAKSICQQAHAIANTFRIGANVMGDVDVNVNVGLGLSGLDFANGNGDATLTIDPYAHIFVFHGTGHGTLGLSVSLPPIQTQFHASAQFTIGVDIPHIYNNSWDFGPWCYPPCPSMNRSALGLSDVSLVSPRSSLVVVDALMNDTSIVSGVPAGARPVFGSGDGAGAPAAAAWRIAHSTGADDPGDIQIALRNSGWQSPALLTNDAAFDGDPVIAVDNNNHVIICWERNTVLPAPVDQTWYDASYQRMFDIAFAVVNSANGHVDSMGTFGGAGRKEFNPRLSKGHDGSIRLTWESSAGGSLFGESGDSLTLHTALWNGTQWTGPVQVGAALTGVVEYKPAAFNADTAFIALVKDTDGDGETIQDAELFVTRRTTAGWTGLQRLTNDLRHDYAAISSYDGHGNPILAWVAESVLVGVRGDLSAPPAVWLGPGTDVSAQAAAGTMAVVGDSIVFAWSQYGKVRYSSSDLNTMMWQPVHFVLAGRRAQSDPSVYTGFDGNMKIGYLDAPFVPESSVTSATGSIMESDLPLSYSPSKGMFTPLQNGIEFGGVGAHTHVTRQFTVLNTGTTPLRVTSLISSNPHFVITPDTATIPALGSFKFDCTYSPDTLQSDTSVILVLHDGANAPTYLHCSGTAIPAAGVENGLPVPGSFALNQAFPNPFNPSTTISFDLPSAMDVTLEVYDVLGQTVLSLADHRPFSAGTHYLRADMGRLAGGVYFYRIVANDGIMLHIDAKRMVLMK